MAVLVALASIAVPLLTNTTDTARDRTTRESLRQIQDVISNRYATDMRGTATIFVGYLNAQGNPLVLPGPHSLDSSRVSHPQLNFLFVNPSPINASYNSVTHMGWNGPYLMNKGATYPGMNSNAVANGFTNTYGVSGTASDPTVVDGWGNPIVIQSRTYNSQTVTVLVSAGPDGVLGAEGTAIDIVNAQSPDDIGVLLQ